MRQERLLELREWAHLQELRYRQETSAVAAGKMKITRAYPELREVFGRAFAAIVYLTG
jgi:hypothetical protein